MFAWLVTAAVVVLCLAPPARVLVRLFWVDGSFNTAAFTDLFAMPDLWELIITTLVMAVATSAISLAIGSALAWFNERTDARVGAVTDTLPLTPFLLPSIAGAVGWVLLLSPRAGYINVWIRDILGWAGVDLSRGPFDIYSWYGLLLVMVIYQTPFVFLMVTSGLRNLDPSLEEQARLSGAGVFRTLRRVTLPAIKPSLGAAVLLIMWLAFGAYSIPAIIAEPAGIHVMSVRIVRLINYEVPPDTDTAVALSCVVLLVIAAIWFVQKRSLHGGRFATVSGKGMRYRRKPLGVWKWPVRFLMFTWVFVTTFLPILALALVSLSGFWSPRIQWSNLSLDAFRKAVFDNELTREALKNSIVMGVLGALVIMVAAGLISSTILRRRSRFVGPVDASLKLPAVVSHVVIAVGILLLFAGAPFRLSGTVYILFISYIVLFFPQGSIAADAAAGQVGGELSSAARSCGAGGFRTFRRVELPLMLPGLVAGWALIFSGIAGDLTSSALLSGPGNPVVGYRIFEIYGSGSYAELASVALALVLVSVVVVGGAIALTRSRTVTAGVL